MDIRTKLVFTLVAVALASMVALAFTAYQTVADELRRTRLEQLSGLAAFKVRSLESIVEGWHDRVALVASRDRLLNTLADYADSPDDAAAERLAQLLGNVRRTSPGFHQLWVLDDRGRIVATAGPDPGHDPVPLDVQGRIPGEPWFVGTVFPESGEPPLAAMAVPLGGDGISLGYLVALLTIDEVVQISRNYEGLGETGETMVVTRDDGVGRTLHSLRAAPVAAVDSTFDARAFDEAGLVIEEDGLAARSLQEEDRQFAGNVIDYRGQEVWAATDYLPETGWGVLVKIDDAEQAAPIVQIRNDLVRLAVMLAAFAILVGTFLGIRFAQPIHLLAEAANKIREGDLGARTGIEQQDEVGLLAQTFDKMATELEEQMELLVEYQLFFDMSIDMMCIAGLDGYFKRVNPAFTRELGWSEEELLSRPFVAFVHPDDVDKTLAEMEKLDEGIPTIRFENRYQCKDGSYREVQWRSTPDQGTGRLYAIARVRAPRQNDGERGT